jgi:hypothetical protein
MSVYGQTSYGYSPFGVGLLSSPPVVIPFGWGTTPWGYGAWGYGGNTDGFEIITPESGAVGVSRRTSYVVKILDVATFSAIQFSLVVDGSPIVIAGIVSDGWQLNYSSDGTDTTVTVSSVSAPYLPASTVITASVSYASKDAHWSFTTGAAFVVTKTEMISNQVLRVYFSRVPRESTALWQASNYGLNPARGVGASVQARSIKYSSGALFVDVSLATKPRRGSFYDVEVYGVTDINGEEIVQ